MVIDRYLKMLEDGLNNEIYFIISSFNDVVYSDNPITVNSDLFSKIVTLKEDLVERKDPRYEAIKGCGGVYLFKCTKKCEIPFGANISSKWRANRSKTMFNKDIVYIGKAKNLLRRIHSHYSDSYKNSSLFLKRNQNLKESCFMVIFALNRQYDMHKDYLISYIEKKLHDNLLYAIGNGNK